MLIWSAGCSTGEEPYTLAMVLSEYAQSHPGFRFRILATDISTAVLDKAALGVFTSRVVQPVPAELAAQILHAQPRSAIPTCCAWFRSCARLIEFRRLNFMEPTTACRDADAIFCRNVIIYFDRPTQERILRKAQLASWCRADTCSWATPRTLHEMDLPLVPVAPALYRKDRWPKHNIELPEVYLQPGEVHLARSPRCSRRCWAPVSASRSGVRGWASARCAMACLPQMSAPGVEATSEGYRYVDFAIRDLARRFDALWRRRARSAGQAVWRRRCAARSPGELGGRRSAA